MIHYFSWLTYHHYFLTKPAFVIEVVGFQIYKMVYIFYLPRIRPCLKCVDSTLIVNDSVAFFSGLKATSVEVESCTCTAVSMSMFDKLQENGIVQENGYIKKCFEEYIESVPMPDELRNVSIAIYLLFAVMVCLCGCFLSKN